MSRCLPQGPSLTVSGESQLTATQTDHTGYNEPQGILGQLVNFGWHGNHSYLVYFRCWFAYCAKEKWNQKTMTFGGTQQQTLGSMSGGPVWTVCLRVGRCKQGVYRRPRAQIMRRTIRRGGGSSWGAGGPLVYMALRSPAMFLLNSPDEEGNGFQYTLYKQQVQAVPSTGVEMPHVKVHGDLFVNIWAKVIDHIRQTDWQLGVMFIAASMTCKCLGDKILPLLYLEIGLGAEREYFDRVFDIY